MRQLDMPSTALSGSSIFEWMDTREVFYNSTSKPLQYKRGVFICFINKSFTRNKIVKKVILASLLPVLLVGAFSSYADEDVAPQSATVDGGKINFTGSVVAAP